MRGDERQCVERRAALIDGARAEIDDRHQRRAIDRRAAADQRGVRQERSDRRQHRGPAEPPGDAEAAQQQPRENRDVAARDRDHVIGSGLLQPALHVVVEAGPIADDDRRDDRAPTARSIRRRRRQSRAARRRARRISPPSNQPAAREHVDQRRRS